MAYIGQGIKSGTFSVLDTSGNTYNGSNVTFSLGTQVGSPAQLLVSHDGVIQKPGTDYSLASGGTQITFSTAPASGASIFIVEISGAVGGPLDSDLNGTELILDADGDTSITADTDDQIDFKIAGADDLRMTANAINVLSGTTLTIDSGATITNSGTASGFGALAGIDDQSSSNDDQLTITDTAVVINEDSDDVDFRVESNGNANMLFISGGNDVVGIGAEGDLGVGLHVKSADSGASVSGDADEAVFEASGHGGITLLNGTSHEGSINFGDSGDNDIGRLSYDHSANAMFVTTNAAIRMKIHDDGDVNIGGGGDAGSFTNEASLHVTRANGQNADVLVLSHESTSFDQQVITAQCSRDTSNATWLIMQGRNGGGQVMTIKDSGNLANTNNNYGSLSDSRVKQDVADANSQWDDIKALKIRKFKLKKYVNKDGADNTPYHLGVIAQELEASGMNGLVEEVKSEKEDVALHSDFGTVVDGTADNGAVPIRDDDGNITGYKDVFTAGQNKKEVKYSILYMKAIKALQEAMAKIESLEARVTTLEG